MPAIDVPEARANKVFFSYARKDGRFVLQLASALRVDGIALWLDQLDIPKGSHWDEAVESALKECGCLLVVLSPASVGSQNVQDEVSYALEAGKRVIPLLMTPCVVPFRLQRIQYVDFNAGYEQAYQELLAALGQARLGRALRPSLPHAGAPRWPSWKKLAPAVGGALAAGLIVTQWQRLTAADKAPIPSQPPVVVPPVSPPKPVRPGPPGTGTEQPPAPAPVPATMTDEQLLGFVSRYLAAQDSGDLAGILSLYDARVRYFNANEVGTDFIRDDKQRFHRRWPHRESRLTGPVQISRLANDQVKLSFSISWLARGPAREASGTALDELVVRLVGGEPKIIAEQQTMRSPGKRG